MYITPDGKQVTQSLIVDRVITNGSPAVAYDAEFYFEAGGAIYLCRLRK